MGYGATTVLDFEPGTEHIRLDGTRVTERVCTTGNAQLRAYSTRPLPGREEPNTESVDDDGDVNHVR